MLEVRHSSFEQPEFIDLLREHGVAVVVADTAGKWPLIEDVTSDFVYVRLHGDEELYVSGYTPEALAAWHSKGRQWRRGANPAAARCLTKALPLRRQGRDLYVYFDNDVKVRAPYDAMSLAHLFGLGPQPDVAPSIDSIVERPRAAANWRWSERRARSKSKITKSVPQTKTSKKKRRPKKTRKRHTRALTKRKR